jgi:hypothetical protein
VAEVSDFIREIRRLFATELIRDYLDRLKKTKYLAPLDPDLDMDGLDELDDPGEHQPWRKPCDRRGSSPLSPMVNALSSIESECD